MEAKLTRLAQVLADAAPGIVAVSGGVDSRFLSFFAWRRQLDYTAVFLDGPHMSPAERSWAVDWLQRNAPDFQIISLDLLTLPQVRTTSEDRCYHCKRLSFERIVALARQLGRPRIFDGGTGSDRGEYRPGTRALRELDVGSPLAACGISKSEIRLAGARMGLDWSDQPSRPCLLTRFNYGLQAEASVLERLGRAEDALFALGLRRFRLRIIAPDQAALHVAQEEAVLLQQEQETVRRVLLREDFAEASLETVGELSGYFDRTRKENDS